MTATVSPADATYPDITWTTSDESIAVISEGGILTAVSKGEVTVYARTADGAEESVDVHVRSKGTPVVGAAVLGGGGYGVYKAIQSIRRRKQKQGILIAPIAGSDGSNIFNQE